MKKITFLGARLEKDIIEMVEKTASEERIDKTKALKELIVLGRKRFLIKKHLDLYASGGCSIDKAAEAAGLTITEMMQEAAKAGLKSSETIEEYRAGLRMLLENK